MREPGPIVVIGAGPAGLGAAYKALQNGQQPYVLEKGARVGGLARTEEYKGYRFDLGGHRFYTKVTAVQDLWEHVLGAEFKVVKRQSRIYFDGRFFKYPLEMQDVLTGLSPIESAQILISYLSARIRPYPVEDNFEQWVSNRFGKRLYQTFFKTYTHKVWGIPPSEISAEWAAQRIRGLSLTSVAAKVLFGRNQTRSMIDQFHYPALGPGRMWERIQQMVTEAGGEVALGADVTCVKHNGNRVFAVTAEQGNRTIQLDCAQCISSMPVGELILRLDPPPPAYVLDAANGLRHRDFILVVLIVDQPDLFEDQWIYVHTPHARVGRIQNYKNWSVDMLPDQSRTSLGMEYFCSQGDDLWNTTDSSLIELAVKDLERLGLGRSLDVEDGVVIRQRMAYPFYNGDYLKRLEVIRDYLHSIANLQTIGRNGMHRYNNMDHSVLTGLQAVENIFGMQHDLWDVNTDRSYYETFTTKQ